MCNSENFKWRLEKRRRARRAAQLLKSCFVTRKGRDTPRSPVPANQPVPKGWGFIETCHAESVSGPLYPTEPYTPDA